jgi:hypothetical protein
MIKPLAPETLAWLRHAASCGQRDAQATLHNLECLEALEAAQQQPHQDKLDRLIALNRDDDKPTPGAAPVATDNSELEEELFELYQKRDTLIEALLSVYDLGFSRCMNTSGRQHGAAQPAPPVAPAEALAARPLLEKVARLGDCIGQQTVAQVQQLAEQASAWLRDNPPGQPVAIEPRGCPAPGACSCVEPTPEAAPGIFPVEYADANGDGIRIVMEPAEETGQVCWVVRDSRHVSPLSEFPTPEAAHAAHQAAQPPAPQPAPPAAPVGGLVEELARIIASDSSENLESFVGIAKDVIRKVAADARSKDLNGQSVAVMTWEGVAQWIEREADR